MFNVARVMAELNRDWVSDPPVEEAALDRLQALVPLPFPREYIDLLRYCNGGVGPLALSPLWFLLYSAELAAQLNTNPDKQELWPGLFDFGSNGGGARIAFDIRGVQPWPIVRYDPIDGVRSAEVIAVDMAEFVLAIGLESSDAE